MLSMDFRFQKTEAGRAEMQARSRVQARSARNLLMVLDANKSARDWLGLVQGASKADLQLLLNEGLIEPLLPPGMVWPPVAEGTASAAAETAPSANAEFDRLYDYLNSHAKSYLGLIKGYKLALDLERCSTLAELQALAAHFVDQVREAKGEIVATQARRAMGLPF